MTECKKVSGFGRRLSRSRTNLNLSRSQVCKELGNIAISTLQAWESEVREPPISMLMNLAKILNVTPNYLLTGENTNNNEQQATRKFEQQSEIKGVTVINSFASINVSAGFGSFNEGTTEPDGEEPYSESLLASLGVKPAKAAVFWASGDSMNPTIENGDQMLVDLSRNQLRGDSKIYLVQNGDSVWVKRIRKRWDGIELISDNSEIYEPIFIPASEAEYLQIIGQVVHIGHSFE